MSMIADKEELLMVLDENGNSTNKLEKRSIVHNNQLYHNEIALWVINGDKVLLQRRSPNKKQNPNKLALCAGHVVENETIEEALYKEAKEEIGLDLTIHEVKPLLTIKRNEKNNFCFSHHFYIKADIPLTEFLIQKEELTELLYQPLDWVIEQTKNEASEVVFNWNENYQNLFNELKTIISE